MKNETLNIANIKCGGCAHSITTKLTDIDGVEDVKVDFDNGTVDLSYKNLATRSAVIDKLSAMGYPEATAENGLLMQAKSYANCMVGKITK
ncbi:heavy-metal-associated domain-containing protein [Bacteroidia bacterium]|nr:heavy-metal-associated domain-containing protein [Bacteroidia bacterium]MDB9881760.1 heavy-metal-associated domain-containing protein [Bacteroidia bacterium]